MDTIQKLIGAFEAARDSRILSYPLMGTIWPTLFICVSYVFLVHKSRSWMANREAFQVQKILVLYNIGMVILSAWLVFEMLYVVILDKYSLGCQPVDTSDTPHARRMVRVAWAFYFTKVVELCDTMFFCLRKKFHLVTFLHVFHHVSMPPSVWLGINVAPGGFGTFYAMLNSLIHVFMYTYYGIAAAGPAYQRYIWWKRYMTHAQMLQFGLLLLHAQQLFWVPCDYPFPIAVAICVYALIFFVLFSNYYYQTYFGRKSRDEVHGKSKDKEDRTVVTNGANSSTPNGCHKNGEANGHATTANGNSTRLRKQ